MNLFHGNDDQSGVCRDAHAEEFAMVRTTFATISAAVIMSALFAPAEAAANTLNIHVRPNIPINTTLHVDVKPRLYRDVVLVDSCGSPLKPKGRSLGVRKRCQLDD
jgi:hypothetical protein